MSLGLGERSLVHGGLGILDTIINQRSKVLDTHQPGITVTITMLGYSLSTLDPSCRLA